MTRTDDGWRRLRSQVQCGRRRFGGRVSGEQLGSREISNSPASPPTPTATSSWSGRARETATPSACSAAASTRREWRRPPSSERTAPWPGARVFPRSAWTTMATSSSYGDSNSDIDNDGAVIARRFSSSGSVLGFELQVNTYITGDQTRPAVGVDAEGDFAVSWASYPGIAMAGVFARRFSSAGTSTGAEFQVNILGAIELGKPAIAADADGDFVIVWFSSQDFGSVLARRFKSPATPTTGELTVSLNVCCDGYPAVDAEDYGDFVVAWAGNDGPSASDCRDLRAALRRTHHDRRRRRRSVPAPRRWRAHSALRLRFHRKHAHHRRGGPGLHPLRCAVDHEVSEDSALTGATSSSSDCGSDHCPVTWWA